MPGTFLKVLPFFFPASGEPIDVVLINNAPGGQGNDLAIDDIVIYQSLCDFDNDGIPNYLDLDSDNDGCPDALEGAGVFAASQLTSASGTISAQSPSQNFGTTVDVNGVPIVVGAVGQGIGQSQDAAKNDCLDSDGDGYPDWQDRDDDNDGILDAVESPGCYYTLNEANSVASVMSSLSGAGNDPNAGNDITLLYNGNNNDGEVAAAFNFAGGQTLVPNLPIFTVKYPTSIALQSLTVVQATNGMASGGFAKLYGSNDGVSYSLLTVGNGISISGSVVTFNNTSTTEYLYYQIRYTGTVAVGNATNIAAGTTAVHEIYSAAASQPVYNPSSHPKSGNCAADTDGDGIPNQLDLDSDNDGCPDALEGSQGIASSQLVNSGGTVIVGAGSSALNQNLCAGTSCVDVNGVPVVVGAAGQEIGSSQNAVINDVECLPPVCYKPAATGASGVTLATPHGITSLGRAGADNDNWPTVRKGAWTAMESKTKGFVVNRVPATAALSAITNPLEGMMVYDEEEDCLKIYTTTDGTSFSWKCFTTPACPD